MQFFKKNSSWTCFISFMLMMSVILSDQKLSCSVKITPTRDFFKLKITARYLREFACLHQCKRIKKSRTVFLLVEIRCAEICLGVSLKISWKFFSVMKGKYVRDVRMIKSTENSGSTSIFKGVNRANFTRVRLFSGFQ